MRMRRSRLRLAVGVAEGILVLLVGVLGYLEGSELCGKVQKSAPLLRLRPVTSADSTPLDNAMLSRIAFRRALSAPSNKRRCLSSSSTLFSIPPPASSSRAPTPPYRVLFFGADTFSCEVFKKLHAARGGASFLYQFFPFSELILRSNRSYRRDHGRNACGSSDREEEQDVASPYALFVCFLLRQR
jgi:hypothetical protein